MIVEIPDALIFWEDERGDEDGVLTFTTDALKEDLEITGPLTLTFWAKTEYGNHPMTDAQTTK